MLKEAIKNSKVSRPTGVMSKMIEVLSNISAELFWKLMEMNWKGVF